MVRRRTRWAAAGAATALALTGCAGGSGAGSGDAAVESVRQGPGGSSADGAKGGQQDSASPAGDADGQGSHVALTAGLTITVAEVERASAQVRAAAARAGGYVSSEATHIDPHGADGPAQDPIRSDGSWAEIVVTVPVAELDATLARLARIGEVVERTRDSEDVSRQYTDTRSRVRTLQGSVTRLQQLIDSAEDLEEIVALEAELTEREADLESMTSRQEALEKRTATAPITVSLQTAAVDEPVDSGFLTGLDSGWDGFTTALGVGLTVLGAVTPFAVTALVLALPALWLWRRLRRPRDEVA